MKFKTVTIGGGNKNFFFSKCCLEFLIIHCLKSSKINKHIHIGHIPRIRIFFLHFLLIINNISRSKFEYLNQVKSLDLISRYKNAIVISSAPLVGSLTILRCWGYKLPVLIYDPKLYYINFSTFLKDDSLVWQNFKQLSEKMTKVTNNYKEYSNEYHQHFLFLKKNKTSAEIFLINQSKNKYNFHKSNESIYGKNNFISILFTLILKMFYLSIKMMLIVFYLYINPFLKKE